MANGVTNWAGGVGTVVPGNFQGLLNHKTDEQIFAILEQIAVPPTVLPTAPQTNDPTTNNDPSLLPPTDPTAPPPPTDPTAPPTDPSALPPAPPADPTTVNQSLPCDPTVAVCTAPPCDPTTTACTTSGGGL